MEKKAERELEKMRDPWKHVRETTEEIAEQSQKQEMCNNKKLPPSAD